MNIALSLFRAKNRVMGFVRPEATVDQAKELFLTPRLHPLKGWEKVKEEEGRRIGLENGLSAIAWGDSNRKVLMVHGWESRATQMSGFVDDLLHRGFQVIALDGPAHGHSEGQKANPYVFAKAVSLAYKTLGPFEGVIAHSMGGSAVGLALSQETDCAKIVLISSPSSIYNVLRRFSAFIGLSSSNTQRFIQLIESVVGLPAEALNTASNLKGYCGKGLIIHDKSDQEVPYGDALNIVENWQSARLISTEGLGHRAVLRQPEIWQEVAEFMV